MKSKRHSAALALIVLAFATLGCSNLISQFKQGDSKPSANSNSSSDSDTSGKVPEEKNIPRPADGKASVWGQVFFDSKPVSKIEVKLCEKLNSFLLNCDGKTYKATTNDNGEYLLADVDPMEYEGLIVKVFNTNLYIYETSGYTTLAKKYTLSPGQTLFMTDTHLFKNDLKVTSPKSKSTTAADSFTVTWEAYPNAAHYKISMLPASGETAEVYNVEVEGTSFKPESPLKPGEYTLLFDAFNKDDKKLAQMKENVRFTVK